MSTAWAPRITATKDVNGDITDDTETLVATVGGIISTQPQQTLWVHGSVTIDAGADTTGVVITAYLGPVASGLQVGHANYTSDQLEGNNNTCQIDGLLDLGDGVEGEVVNVTVTCTGASAEGGFGPGVIIAVVF